MCLCNPFCPLPLRKSLSCLSVVSLPDKPQLITKNQHQPDSLAIFCPSQAALYPANRETSLLRQKLKTLQSQPKPNCSRRHPVQLMRYKRTTKDFSEASRKSFISEYLKRSIENTMRIMHFFHMDIHRFSFTSSVQEI